MSLYDQSKGLSNLELEHYFTKHNIPFNEVDNMNKLNNPRTKQSIVYTGTQPDAINNGVTKHWTYYSPFNKSKKELFDSYGDPTVYNQQFLNKNNINFVNRRQFQAFDTNVCGEYCAAWAKFLNEHPQSSVLPSSHLVEEFAQKHNLTKNRIQNDKNIRDYYQQTA